MTRADDTPIADYANMLRLEGRRYVILGAGQGIGRQAAHALAVNGAQLVCVDVEKAKARMERWKTLIVGLTIFVLAIFVGFEVIAKVPPLRQVRESHRVSGCPSTEIS